VLPPRSATSALSGASEPCRLLFSTAASIPYSEALLRPKLAQTMGGGDGESVALTSRRMIGALRLIMYLMLHMSPRSLRQKKTRGKAAFGLRAVSRVLMQARRPRARHPAR
jgi:hypothetical protein